MKKNISYTQSPITIQTIYGTHTILEPVLCELITCPSMQRLKYIHQHGISAYLKKESKYFSRFDHSLGVLILLQKYGTPLEEQISGLLHDVSHTVFSHVGDILFKHTALDYSYQDIIHKTFLKKTEINTILHKHGFCLDDVLHKNGCFPALEQDLPHICADRLDYNLQEGVLVDLININDVTHILKHLHFEDEQWFFDDATIAKQFASISLHMTQKHFAAPWNILTYQWMAQALQRALDINLVSTYDIHFATDDEVWKTLHHSNDEIIKQHLYNIHHHEDMFRPATKKDFDLHIKAKFRGINPFVKKNSKLEYLSDIDATFEKTFKTVKHNILNGHYITFTKTYQPAQKSFINKRKTLTSYQ